MTGERQIRRAYCYAAFYNGKANASAEMLTQFANETMGILRPEIVVEKSYIDLHRISLSKPHPGWDAMLSDAKQAGIKTLVIPAMPLLNPYILDVYMLLSKLKDEHDIDVFFVRENFFTATDDVTKHLAIYFASELLIHPMRLSVKER